MAANDSTPALRTRNFAEALNDLGQEPSDPAAKVQKTEAAEKTHISLSEDVVTQLFTAMQQQQATMANLLIALQNRPTETVREATVVERVVVQEPPSAPQEPPAATPQATLPADLLKSLARVKTRYLHAMRKYDRARHRLESHNAIITCLAEATDNYPPGVKPFTSSPTLQQLDDVFAQPQDIDAHYHITIPRGTTRRTAMRMFHRIATYWMKQAENEALAAHLDQCKLAASKSTLQSMVDALVSEARSKNHAEGLELDATLTDSIPSSTTSTNVEAIFSSAVRTLEKELNQKSEKDKAARLEKENTDRDLLKADPHSLLQTTIREIAVEEIRAAMAPDDGDDAMDEDAPAEHPHSTSRLFIDSIQTKASPKAKAKPSARRTPKNDLSPGDAPGHNPKGHGCKTRKQQKGKGKGKHASKGKAKGSGKGGKKGSHK